MAALRAARLRTLLVVLVGRRALSLFLSQLLLWRARRDGMAKYRNASTRGIGVEAVGRRQLGGCSSAR